MKKYNVQVTDSALKDMDEIYDYISNELLSPETAMEQYNRIADAILTLDEMPERFTILSYEPFLSRKLYHMNVDNYVVFYVILDDNVIVTDVLYGASDLIERIKGL